MSTSVKKKNPWRKRILIGILLIGVVGIGVAWYIFTEKFEDTASAKADYTVNALDLLKEFRANDSAANRKYTEKTLVVNGTVSEIESADSTINIKIADSTGSYAIFAFQEQHLPEAKTVKEGQQVSIKGSCSGGVYSQILETEFVSFKRCALNK